MRFGLNNFVAGICIVIAIVGTWVLLSPQLDTIESVVPARQASGSNGISAFASAPAETVVPREPLRTAPRATVGFDSAPLPEHDDDLFVEPVAPVQPLGPQPQDARALSVETRVEPASNISDAHSLGRFEVRAASRRGSDHAILDEPRQDDYVVATAGDGRYLVVVVADGLGSAENAHFGSYWASRILARTIDLHLREGVPGIEKMLARTREDLSELFDMTFTDGTKLRSIATSLVGLIAPADGGPAAGFRVGDCDILRHGAGGWSSVFDASIDDLSEVLFPRSIDAEVAPIDFDLNCLLLATDGVADPISTDQGVAASYSSALAAPVSEVEFDQLMAFPLEEARGDRTAVAVWFSPS